MNHFVLDITRNNHYHSRHIENPMKINSHNQKIDMENHNQQLNNIQRTLDIIYVPEKISEISNMISILAAEIGLIKDYVSKITTSSAEDGYMTPERAMQYLDMTKNTFDKYRYKSKIPIPSFRLDGSNRYKKSDLDRFMLTYNDQIQLLAA
jgi:hypothetical protein